MDNIRILDNFIDNDTCDSIIQVYDRLFKDRSAFIDNRKVIRNSQEPEILNFLKTYIDKISLTLGNTFYIRECFLSLYLTNSYMQPHIDYYEEEYKDSLGVLIYFNEDFEGGELAFPKFDYHYKPKKGSAIIFPCNKEPYQHGVKKVTSGLRYTMPLEITKKKELSVYDF